MTVDAQVERDGCDERDHAERRVLEEAKSENAADRVASTSSFSPQRPVVDREAA
jgi:hypothetical protein